MSKGLWQRNCFWKGLLCDHVVITIKFSNALLVKVADEGEASDKYKKIQDKVFFKAYAKICCIEDLCHRVDCKKNDACAAEIVVEKLEEIEKEDLPDNNYISDIKVIDFSQTDNESTNQRKGIRYIFKKTGYTEIACPIRLYDRTMGALIEGQIYYMDFKVWLYARLRCWNIYIMTG